MNLVKVRNVLLILYAYIQLCRVMKCIAQSVGEVLNLTWTGSGLAVCCKNTNVSGVCTTLT